MSTFAIRPCLNGTRRKPQKNREPFPAPGDWKRKSVQRLARFPIGRNRPTEKKSRCFKTLKRIPVEKASRLFWEFAPWRALSEIERSVHSGDEDREKEDDEADPSGDPSKLVHFMQRHVFSSRYGLARGAVSCDLRTPARAILSRMKC
jgi:hypothetical protein